METDYLSRVHNVSVRLASCNGARTVMNEFVRNPKRTVQKLERP